MSEIQQKIRVRFAPSPTGYLHVGGLRTALYNYLFARKNGGDFILRIEDTDQSRLVDDAVEKLIRTLKIFFDWDEGVKFSEDETKFLASSGSFGPYVQSERLHIYREHAESLINNRTAYRCFCTSDRLEALRKDQADRKEPTRYDGHCRDLSNEEIGERLRQDMPHVVRLRVEGSGEIIFNDAVRGKVSFSKKTLDDQVLMKSDGFPTYHLANVVDDHLMGITHVIRGEEWLPSTPKHLLLYAAFGWDAPIFAHIPLLLNPDRSKLSKRQGDVAVEEYLAKGYLQEALVNFVALLGWNPGGGETREIFSLRELVEAFDIDHVHKGGAIFDVKKLDWINSEYIKRLSEDKFLEVSLAHFKRKTWYGDIPIERTSRDFLANAFLVERDRLRKFADIGESSKFLFLEPLPNREILPWKGNSAEDTKRVLIAAREVLQNIPNEQWTRDGIGEVLLRAAGEKRGDFLWPLRVALSGERQSPPPQEIAWVIGKESCLSRIDASIRSL